MMHHGRFAMFPVIGACIAFVVSLPAAQCPPYSVERSKSIEVGPTDNLRDVFYTAASNTVIYLKSGTYRVSGTLQIIADSITVRSKSGNRDDVILDGNTGGVPFDRSKFTAEAIAISASDVYLVDISVCFTAGGADGVVSS